MSSAEDNVNQIIDWLERLSQKEGYEEARQLRRDIIEAMGPDGVTWDGMTPEALAKAVSHWLAWPRENSQLKLPGLPVDIMSAVTAAMRSAMLAHANEYNRPATLAVEQYGDALQALWSVLRPDSGGPGGSDPAAEAPKVNLKSDFKLGR